MSDAKTIADGSVPKLPWEVFPEEGDSFANYVLGEAIGKGSFGTVFKVQSDPGVEWFEAVKILHRSGDIDKKRFLEEISRLKEIRIPGMARIHAAGEYDGYLYYSMDYIEGATIDDYVESGNEGRIFPLFFELCNTVQRLHELNFVHLDIKPHNVMVNEEGQVMLLDLGISQKTDEGKDISSEGFGAGTYEYAPAEQIDGKTPNNSMDVYALGCLLYTLLTSAHPKIPYDSLKREKPYGKFYSKSNLERKELLDLCLKSEIKDICEHDVLLNDTASSVIMKSLVVQGERYQSVQEFKEALEKSGVLLDHFVVSYDELPAEIYSRVNKAVNDISLEFSSQLQVFFKKKSVVNQIDLFVSAEESTEKGVLRIADSDDVSTKFVKELRKRLFDKANKVSDSEAWEHSPYRSLSSYSEEDASLFFGRDSEIIDIFSLIERIPSEQGLVAVLAPSGAGKSSFLQAGVIPYFKNEGWLTDFSWPGSGGFAQLESGIDIFLNESSSQKKLVIIDQFEEFLHDQNEFDRIAGSLQKWAMLKDVMVVVSLRNDFYKEYISFIELNKLPDNFYNLPQPDEVNLSKMIKMPALKAGITFEKDPLTGKGLDEVLKDEAMLNPESLAALSFTLDEIFNKSVKGRMSFGVYSELGGMHGAMAKRAESLFRSLKLKRANQTFHHVFHQLIQVDENRIPRRLHAEYLKLTSDEESKLLTDEFIKAKLFQVTSEADTKKRIVTVSHEALIQQNQENGWRRVMFWLNRQRNNLLVRKRLAVAVNDWLENKRQPRFLYSSYGRLKEILELRDSGWSLSDIENIFIKQSSRAVIRNIALIAVSLVALVWISISLWFESNTVTDLTKNINERRQEVERLSGEANKQREVLESLRLQEARAKDRLSAMDNYNRLSLISSLQQNGALPPATAISLLSEVSEENRNWLWGQLLYKSLPDFLMLFGHEEEVLSVEFSPDEKSKYLLTSSWDNTVKLWDGLSGELIKDLPWTPATGVKMDFEDAGFSYDGHVVAASNDGYIYIWNIEEVLSKSSIAKAVKIPHEKIRKLFFSKDGKYMTCSGSEGKFSIWNWQNRDFVSALATGVHTDTKEEDLQRVYSAEISPNGKTVISVGWNGEIKKWSWNGNDLGGGKVVGSHESQIWSGTFNKDGSCYLTAGRDRVAKLWDVETFNLMNEYGASGSGAHKSDIRSAVFSPDGNTVVTASRDKNIRFWDMESGNLFFERQVHDNVIYEVSFSTDGERFSTASADRVVNLCYLDNFMTDNVKPGRVLYHSEPVEHFDVLQDTIVTASSDGTVRLWDLYPGTLRSYFVHRLAKKEFLLKSFLIDRENVLTADTSGNIFMWKLNGDEWIKDRSLNAGGEAKLYDLVLSPAKDFLAASFSDGQVMIWQLSDGKLVFSKKAEGMKNPVISFSTSGEYLAIGDDSGSVSLISWKIGHEFFSWKPHQRKIFDLKVTKYKGEEVVISSSRDGSVLISNFKGKVLNSVSHGIRGDASYAAISSDRLFMATASARDSNVFIWDLKNGIELLPLSGHEEPVSQVEFVNDDLIVSASRDGTVRLWYSLSWEQLKRNLPINKTGTSQEMLQKVVRQYLYGSY